MLHYQHTHRFLAPRLRPLWILYKPRKGSKKWSFMIHPHSISIRLPRKGAASKIKKEVAELNPLVRARQVQDNPLYWGGIIETEEEWAHVSLPAHSQFRDLDECVVEYNQQEYYQTTVDEFLNAAWGMWLTLPMTIRSPRMTQSMSQTNCPSRWRSVVFKRI